MTTFAKTFAPGFPVLATRFLNELDNYQQVKQQSNVAVNIVETDDAFELHLAAPGLKKELFEIKVVENNLVISATKETQSETQTQKFTKKEFDFSNVKRTFTLSKIINTEAIEAQYIDGILVVKLPKLEEAKPKEPRTISVL